MYLLFMVPHHVIFILIAGPIQFTGPGSDALSHTLLLKLGDQ